MRIISQEERVLNLDLTLYVKNARGNTIKKDMKKIKKN